jgi:hypothetical protein
MRLGRYRRRCWGIEEVVANLRKLGRLFAIEYILFLYSRPPFLGNAFRQNP